MRPHVSAVVPVPASGPGALPGFQAVCECGLVLKSSIAINVMLDVQAHLAWHERKR